MSLYPQNLPGEEFDFAVYLSEVVEGIRFPEKGKNPGFSSAQKIL